MKDLAFFIVKALAEHPESVTLEESEQDGTTRLRLTVAEEDKGKIIGKQGKVIKAIRAVVSAAAEKQNKTAIVDLD